jgi:hypothetical protein
MIIQTMAFSGNDVWDVQGAMEDQEDVKGMAVLVLLTFSVLGLLFGIMGTFVLCCKNRLYAVCLSILLLFVWVAVLIVAFIMKMAAVGTRAATD